MIVIRILFAILFVPIEMALCIFRGLNNSIKLIVKILEGNSLVDASLIITKEEKEHLEILIKTIEERIEK